MKATKIIAMVAALVLACALAACAGGSMGLEPLDEANGVKVTAENAGADNAVDAEAAFTIKEGDVLVISPCMDKGSFHLLVTETGGDAVAYDEDVDGRVMFTEQVAPGTYDVKVTGNGATGWMTVFSESSDELAAQDASLAETLESAGVDPSVVTANE